MGHEGINMETKDIAEIYDMTEEEFTALDKQLRNELTDGAGNTFKGIQLAFPDVDNKTRAKIFILFSIAKHII